MCSATGGSKKVNSSSKMNEKTSDFGKKDDISKIGGVSSNNETAKKIGRLESKEIFSSVKINNFPDALEDEDLELLKKKFNLSSARRIHSNSGRIIPIAFANTTSENALTLSNSKSNPFLGYNLSFEILVEDNMIYPHCNVCHQWGHWQSSCSGTKVCGICGDDDCQALLNSSRCEHSAFCINCGGPHPSFSRKCRIFREYRDLFKPKTFQQKSFSAAAIPDRMMSDGEIIKTIQSTMAKELTEIREQLLQQSLYFSSFFNSCIGSTTTSTSTPVSKKRSSSVKVVAPVKVGKMMRGKLTSRENEDTIPSGEVPVQRMSSGVGGNPSTSSTS
ncbi:hypothetical protein GJ496_002455 [Pomphorhynchus laevis]|nr:hypothetical protein GJ496_002455 [Pomphorhynchus laevis]